MVIIMESSIHDYSIKKKYCPSMRQNVVFKVENSAEHRETCMNHDHCAQNSSCEWCKVNHDIGK